MSVLAGYRALTARDFNASRFGAFGMLRRQKVMLAKRPLQRLFFLGLAREKYLELEVVTGKRQIERGAVTARVHCFSLTGRKIPVSPEIAEQRFFADCIGEEAVQRLWVRRPPRAVFALISFARTTRGKRIGVSGKLRLAREKALTPALDDLLASRDRLALEKSLSAAKQRGNRQIGRKLLARLIYLWQCDTHRRELAVLEDAERLYTRGLPLPAGDHTRCDKDPRAFVYRDFVVGEPPRNLPLSKWVLHEAKLLVGELRRVGADTIRLQDGPVCPELLLPACAAAALGGFSLEVDGEHSGVGSGWLTAFEIRSIYARYS